MAEVLNGEVHKTAGMFKDIIEVEILESQEKGNSKKLGIVEGSVLGADHAARLLAAMDKFASVSSGLGINIIQKGVPKEEMERKFISSFQSDYTEEFGKQYKIKIDGKRYGVAGEIEVSPDNTPALTKAFEEAAKIGQDLRNKYEARKHAKDSIGLGGFDDYETARAYANLEVEMRHTLAKGIKNITSR